VSGHCPQRDLEFEQNVRRARSGVNPPRFGLDERGRHFEAVDLFEHGFLVEVSVHQLFQYCAPHYFPERRLVAKAMFVIDTLDRCAVRV